MNGLTLDELGRVIRQTKLVAVQPQVFDDDGELCYVLPLPDDRAQAAFDAGLAPFCPLPGAKMPWLP